MAAVAERGFEAGVALAGSRAVTYAREGKYRKAIMWGIPLAVAGLIVWYMRR